MLLKLVLVLAVLFIIKLTLEFSSGISPGPVVQQGAENKEKRESEPPLLALLFLASKVGKIIFRNK